LYKTLKENITRNIKTVFIFSDSCGAQNKNYTVLKFLIWASIYFKVKIIQVFPVRGHSYCVCDRNFSLFSKSVKNIEIIETPEEYVKELTKLNFIVEKGISYNFSDCFDSFLKSTKNMSISTAFKIEYYSDGLIKLFTDYNINPYFSENLVNIRNTNSLLKNLDLDNKHFIAEHKINAVSNLLKYIKPNNQLFIKNHLNKYKNN
jgi:hypothetical protein